MVTPAEDTVTLVEFKRTLTKPEPPAGLGPALSGLWWAAKDDWDRAHALVMDVSDREAAWVHAYLHRVEGDLSNARYWYGQARKPAATGSTQSEWDAIAKALLARIPE